MRITGTYSFQANKQAVWDTLQSPDMLSACLPGCEGFKADGLGQYRVDMQVAIGPIGGNYTAKIFITDQNAPDSYRMTVSGSGSGGTFNGDGSVSLSDDNDGTAVAVDGEVQVTGVAARVGQRLLGSAAKTMLERFFSCMNDNLTK